MPDPNDNEPGISRRLAILIVIIVLGSFFGVSIAFMNAGIRASKRAMKSNRPQAPTAVNPPATTRSAKPSPASATK